MLLRPINFVILLALAAGCAQSPEPTAQIDHSHRTVSQPLVLSSRPEKDTAAFNASEEKLEEADWQLLQTLGPRAIWDKINDKSRVAKNNRAAATQASSPLFSPTTKASKTPEPAPQIPVVTTPDGKIRIVYQLRHYGGSNVTTTVDGGTSRRNVTMKAADLTQLVAVMTTQIGASGIVAPLAEENTLIITCDPAMKDSVLQLLSKIDEAPRQVEINAKMFEVSHDFDFQYGAKLLVNHIAGDNVQQLASTFSAKKFVDALSSTATGGSPEGSVLRLLKVFQESGISVEGTFQLMQDSGLITVVASPRMTVAAGETGYMLAGQELPIQSQSIVNAAAQTTTTYKPVGVQLYITPQAMGDNSVKLHAISIVSAVSGFAPLPTLSTTEQPAQKLINPIIDSREAETTVTIEDGNTLVFGGMRMIRTTQREAKIPGLGDIPGLGWLFKNHRSQKQLTDLYFFVTPTLL